MSTINESQFIDVFKNGLKIIPRTLSVKTLLSERNLKRINYRPYYQRNYVWDIEKQTFFIESILLGTEIPPLILYKSGISTEVIDGRQRFETLKRFKENDFSLNSKGLMDLPALNGESFNTLEDELKEVFLNSYIRVFEFEIITDISPEVEDKIKKEIFRRYNTGITPLTSVEVDSAKYDNDAFSNELEDRLCRDKELYKGLHNCFFPNDKDDENLIGKLIDFLRKNLVMPKFPISRYARSSERREIMELLYESMFDAMDNNPNIDSYLKICKSIIDLHDKLSEEESTFSKQKLMYASILWALLICQQEDIAFDISSKYDDLRQHYKENATLYSDDNSFHYRSIIERYEDTASFFKRYTGVNFDTYIRNSEFSENIKKIKQGENDVKSVVQQLDGLRINKPSPISKPIEEVLSDVITTKYLLRPTYQRQERITEQKASSIIESILLGISLPPIFVYKKNDGVKEVIDGQQRLLSIIAFIGKQYRNEEGKLEYSKNNNFKLKKLKILNDLNGLNFSSLSSQDQDKILDFVIDEINIEQSINANFDPTDLFIRLNQKPYPIQQNSFEMWNSTVDKSVIEKIKAVTNKHISWFYSNETKDIDNRTDRMENEELITLLSYIDYAMSKDLSYNKILGTFKRIDRITCRIKDKNTITDYLTRLEDNNSEKKFFLNYIDNTDKKIEAFGTLFDSLSKETLTDFFNVKNSKTFRRSYQDFYIVWLVLHNKTISSENKDSIKNLITELLCMLRNTEGKNVDEQYYNDFDAKLKNAIK
ncbi:MAG: DUF262 domain-containing protein [Bacteroidales bacterium]|nr:DUF262 domain-containing protein [Bacteroidales bacterium]